jgi:hypothetical protein
MILFMENIKCKAHVRAEELWDENELKVDESEVNNMPEARKLESFHSERRRLLILKKVIVKCHTRHKQGEVLCDPEQSECLKVLEWR